MDRHTYYIFEGSIYVYASRWLYLVLSWIVGSRECSGFLGIDLGWSWMVLKPSTLFWSQVFQNQPTARLHLRDASLCLSIQRKISLVDIREVEQLFGRSFNFFYVVVFRCFILRYKFWIILRKKNLGQINWGRVNSTGGWVVSAWWQAVDLVTFNALISGLAVSRQWLRALTTLAAARLYGLQLTSVTYNATVTAIESWRWPPGHQKKLG